jgi:hypothetical protein
MMGHDRRLPSGPLPLRRALARRPAISRRIAAIAESATLAGDAKAKALKAAGKPVIARRREPDFPTPEYIVEAAVAACSQPAMHRYTPAGRAAGAQGGSRRQDRRDSGLLGHAGPTCW